MPLVWRQVFLPTSELTGILLRLLLVRLSFPVASTLAPRTSFKALTRALSSQDAAGKCARIPHAGRN